MYKFNDSSESQIEQQPAIQPSMILGHQLSMDHLICSICHHIIWQGVCCGSSQGCHTAFCLPCIQSWLQKPNSRCPNCKGTFSPSEIPPIMKALLNRITFKCWNANNGCEQIVIYQNSLAHLRECEYRLKKCVGCRKKVVAKIYETHTQKCEQFIVFCQKCKSKMTKAQYSKHLGNINSCLKQQIDTYSNRMLNLQMNIDEIQKKTNNLQNLTKTLFSGEGLPLQIELFTTFSQNFIFPNPTLIKPSFNPIKQKFDFLHFYVVSPIFTESIISRKWGIKIKKMVGNILIGFCSSMNVNSLDYIINKYGQIKRKDLNQSKYRIIRKAQNFQFGAGDSLTFKYRTSRKAIQITNQGKSIYMELCSSQIEEMGSKFYTFYSLDTLNDSISFI